jgi:hypothetical protein
MSRFVLARFYNINIAIYIVRDLRVSLVLAKLVFLQ